jgi:hypothetical protein
MRVIVGISLLLAFAGCARLDPNAVYFLVSERETFHGDSFIIPLTDPEHIAHARALIQNPDTTDAPIVTAAIERCDACNGVNRDMLNGGARWSWCVTRIDGFADNTIEIYDGWPTYVEKNMDAWFENTDGYIGFWSYTVTRELSAQEILSGQLQEKLNTVSTTQSGLEQNE